MKVSSWPHGRLRTIWLLVETRVRPKLLTDLSPETAKLIEDLTFDSKGRAVPKLYSKLQPNKGLRAMLNISAKETPRDVTQLPWPNHPARRSPKPSPDRA
jgi:hypothetical protein